jgi:hypothetical protein
MSRQRTTQFDYEYRLVIIVILLSLVDAIPTVEMCESFARFAARWHHQSSSSSLVEWVRDNCDRIQPRPITMTCDDVERFVLVS